MEKFFEGVYFKWTGGNEKNIHISMRLPGDLIKRIDEFIEKLELKHLPIRGKGYRSLGIRLLIEDSLVKYMGPKLNPDDLISPYADKMSEILPILRNKRLREKLDEMPDNISHNKKEIDKIIKKFG